MAGSAVVLGGSLPIKDTSYRLHRKGNEESGFELTDQDDAGAVQYHGYVNAEGYWIIRKYDTGANPKTIRWVSGTASYAAAFTNRAALTYDYYNLIWA